MGEIGKGQIVQIESNKAMCKDFETLSLKKSLEIPNRLKDSLKIGMTVAYVYYNDLTGLIIDTIGGDG